MATDPIAERRRKLSRTLLITALVATFMAVANWAQGIHRISRATLPVILICLAMRWYVQRAPTAEVMARVVRAYCLVAAVFLSYVGYLAGGAMSHGTYFLMLVPLIATFFLTRREALAWLGVALSFVVAVAVISHFFPVANPRPDTAIRATMNKLGLTTMLIFIVLSIRRETDSSRAELEAKSRSLAEARDQALQLAVAKSQFLANMSHEIRTPLNGVIGMTDVLLQEDLGAESRRCATTISKSGKALLTVVNDILDFSRLESNNLSIDRNPLEPRAIVADVLESFGHACGIKGIELAQDIPAEVPRFVVGDPNRLRQVLVNLVGNAVKFTKEGSVILGVSSSSNRISFSVTDTGLGIPNEDIERLFSEFSQLDLSTTREFGGTGLGLAISQRLVTLMGGKLGATSTVGSGSRFAFDLPLEQADAQRRAGVGEPVLEPRTIGLLALPPKTSRAAEQIARQLGLNVETFSLGQDDLIAGSAADFWLISANLGGELPAAAERLAKQHPDALRLLLVSVGISHPNLESLGLVGKIHQPLSEHSLGSAVREWTEDPENASGEHSIDDDLVDDGGMSLSVLVAEDNVVNQHVVGRMLAIFGHKVTMVANGLEAVETATATPFDLILMDVHMPQMDGLEAARRIRAIRPNVSIVALTASVLKEQREACTKAGMNGFLTKPVQIRALKKVLADPPTAPLR